MKTALITGASSGIGRACAEVLGQDHNVVLCSRNESLLREVSIKLGKNSRIFPIDVRSELEFVSKAVNHGGFCIGLDRLLAKILDKEMVSEAVPFPRTYKRLIP